MLSHTQTIKGKPDPGAAQVLPKISIDHVTKSFGEADATRPPVIDDVSFTIGHNEFVAIIGRSGCGKSTMLNMIAGIIPTTSGTISIDGKEVTGPGLDRGMVFQQASLFPWLSAKQNIMFGPRNNGVPYAERSALADQLIELVNLQGAEDKYPRELSGGMQQRVNIARSLAMDPEIMLMDEPFGALDELTREDMQRELLRIWEANRKTVLFVTHSITEAIYLSDRILILSRNPGRIRVEIPIELPRPRWSATDAIFDLHQKVYSYLE
jgi:ABC-type nitrate/sulfonate/bicarbonate transport system ATPase subunit